MTNPDPNAGTPPAAVDSAQGWRVTLAAMACLVVGPSTLLVSSFGVLAGPLGREFGWARDQVGLAVSLMAVAIMIAAPLQGILIDRHGVRRVVLLCIPIFAAGVASLAMLPDNLGIFYLAWSALPLLAIGLWPVSYLKTVSSWFDRHLGLATGVANAGIGIGMILLPLIVAWAIESFGVRGGFLAMGGLALLAWLPAWALVRERIGPREMKRAAVATWTYRQIFTNPTYLKIAAAFFLFGVTGTSLVANLVPVMMSKGLQPRVAIAAMTVFGVSALAGRLITGWLLDRYHAARVTLVLGGTTVAALLILSGHPSLTAALVCAGLIGLLSGGEFDVLAFVIRRYFGLQSFGKMYGAAFSAFQLGAAAGAAALATSVGRTDAYNLGLFVLAGCLAIGIAVFLTLPAYPQRGEALAASGIGTP